MDVIGRTLTQPDTQASAFRAIGHGAAAHKPAVRVVGDAELTEAPLETVTPEEQR